MDGSASTADDKELSPLVLTRAKSRPLLPTWLDNVRHFLALQHVRQTSSGTSEDVGWVVADLGDFRPPTLAPLPRSRRGNLCELASPATRLDMPVHSQLVDYSIDSICPEWQRGAGRERDKYRYLYPQWRRTPGAVCLFFSLAILGFWCRAVR